MTRTVCVEKTSQRFADRAAKLCEVFDRLSPAAGGIRKQSAGQTSMITGRIIGLRFVFLYR